MTDAKPAVEPARERLLSLDTLRGFDMFWIIGGDRLFIALAAATGWGWASWWGVQLTHVKWEGLRAYDLIFPLFMFISGVAIPYAFGGRLERGATRGDLVKKVFWRAGVLILLGLVCNRILDFEFSRQRYASVLGQIGLAYLFASLIVLFTKQFGARVIWLVGILAGVAAVQLLVPVPEIGAGVLTPEGCINGYIDRMLMPGRLYGGSFDPEGLLCIVSASGITLLGALAGSVLRDGRFTGVGKTLMLSGAGLALLLVGLLIEPWYPPIKAAWTTTFNLQAGGICLMLLAIFYLVIDVWKLNRWTFFFRVIGLNAITIFMAVRMINFSSTSKFFLTGAASLSETYGPIILIIGAIAVKWLFLLYLYRKKIFLRV